MQTSFSTIRTVTYNFQITAILKLPKLALCPLAAITTQSLRARGGGIMKSSTACDEILKFP